MSLKVSTNSPTSSCEVTEVEGLLAEFVERQAAERDEHAQSLRRSAHVANAFLERNGSLSDEFSAF